MTNLNSEPNKPLFRNKSGQVLSAFDPEQNLNFISSPFDIFIVLARYKFAMRHIKKTHNVADVGIGQGIGSVLLANCCNSLTCLDYDQDLLSQCRYQFHSIQNISYSKYDLLNPSSEFTGQFDVVVSNDVIEHFSSDDTDRVVKSYKELLSDTGFAVIGTPNKESEKYASLRRKSTHLHEFTCEDFRDSLEKQFGQVFIFGMNDEIVSTQFLPMSWYFLALCCK